MRFGILVPQTGPWPVLLERCLEVERLGYESLWIGDHYFLEPLPHFELFEAMTVLGGIAVSVPRVRFGALTTNVIYRNPAVIAKQAATLDQMSGGRFELGLGRRSSPRLVTAMSIASPSTARRSTGHSDTRSSTRPRASCRTQAK